MVSKKCEVDETLFGTRSKKKDAEEEKRIVGEVREGKTNQTDVVMLGESELQRMKNNAIITTKEE